MGLAPTAYALWQHALKHAPGTPDWADRDRVVLSAGHASMLLYSMLHLTGYDLPLDEIKDFRQWESKTPGHPEYGLTAGVEATTGPLGQGLGNAVGFALAEKILANTFNRPDHEIVNHRTYAICSDGDMMEGVASEAASLAGTLQLGKLIVIYDDNQISIEGDTDKAFREDVSKRYEAYGFHIIDPVDGNDLAGIVNALKAADAEPDKPKLITVRSVIGYGSPNLAGTGAVHGKAMGGDEVALTRTQLGWDYEPFEVPDDVYDHMRSGVESGQALSDEWHAKFEGYKSEYPELAERFLVDLLGMLPENWDEGLNRLVGSHDSPIATRAVSGEALHAITPALPRLIGGSADLAESNNTEVDGRGSFSPEMLDGRNLHFGVREHGMGAVCNGMALHGGVIPYAATFLIFSDYLRPAIRVGALSHAPCVWIFTHDSIGLGEDGPTHQPISQLMGLRMIPNLTVIRPADANETFEPDRSDPDASKPAPTLRNRCPELHPGIRPARSIRHHRHRIRTRSDHHRHRLRDPAGSRRCFEAARRRHCRPRGLDAIVGALPITARRLQGIGFAMVGTRSRIGGGRNDDRMGTLRRLRRCNHRHRPLRRLRTR